MDIIPVTDGCGVRESQCRFLQSPFWADFKSAHGWYKLRFQCTDPVVFECSVLVRQFHIPVIGTAAIAYVPMGPDVPEQLLRKPMEYRRLLADFAIGLRSFLPRNTLCIRYDVPVDFESLESCRLYTMELASGSKCRKAPENIQPPDTVLLDLSLPEEKLLQQMKSKWRYNIRLAEKKGVKVRKGTVQDIDIFYNLYQTTASRDGIAIHDKAYYQDLLQMESSGGIAVSLYIAYFEQTPLAAIITLFSTREGVYLYGASSNEHRNLMPAYLLQWNAICDAKQFGCGQYDFYGIPPVEDEQHPMYGLYRFKTGFGGTIIHRPGSIDVPLSLLYSAYGIAERLRSVWFKKIKKILVGR